MNMRFSVAALATVGFFAATARADIAPGPGPGHRRGGHVHKCVEVPAGKDSTPDQGLVDQFLSNRAYRSVSTPEITKLDDGSFRVCATFTR